MKSLNTFNQKAKLENMPITERLNNKNKLSLIEEQNLYLLKRINNCCPYYNVNKWERDYEKSQYYKSNHCQLPIIDFKKYKKINLANKRKNTSRINNDNNSKSYILISKEKNNNSYYINLDNINNTNNNIDFISLHFCLNNQNLSEHPYIIITSLNEYFSEVIKKLFNTIQFLDKENIIGYTCSDNDKILLELNKTVKDNNLKDGSKIIIQFK